MHIDWKPLHDLLRDVYTSENHTDRLSSDGAYLKQAFDATENLWLRQLSRMNDVKTVMLSEAPLFGKKKTYIYNPNSPPSPFFHFNDLKALGYVLENKKHRLSQLDKKRIMIKQMAKKGFLIMDLFPFALNQINTAINYRRMSTSCYKRILFESAPAYLELKLKLVKRKATSPPVFIYRYKKLFEKTGRLVESTLEKLSMIPKGTKLDSINGKNMSLDRDKLTNLFRLSYKL